MTLIQEITFKTRFKALSIFALGFLFINPALFAATFTISSNVSGYSALDTTNTTPVVYASFGSIACTTWDSDDNDEPNTGCAITPISTSSSLNICFTHDNGSAINMYAFRNSDRDSQITENSASTNTNVASGSEGCLDLTWSNVISALKSNDTTNCTDTHCQNSFYVYSDSNTDGTVEDTDFKIQVNVKYSDWSTAAFATASTSGNCSSSSVTNFPCILAYSFTPGDSKAYLYSVNDPQFVVNSAWPDVSDHLPIKYVRFYYGIGTGLTDVDIESTNYTDLQINDDGSFVTDNISGLINDQTYYFRAAVVDAAGSVGYMLDITSTSGMATGYTPFAKPAEVFGVFENSRCFIATAAYGSPLAPKLDQLRNFRDQILLKYSWGKKFVSFYYEHSPKYAAMLMDSPILQKTVQVLLWPAWVFSALSLRFSIEAVSLVSLLLFSLILVRIKRRKAAI